MNVLSIQSTVTYGRVGHRAAVLPLERLGHDVWPLDTVVFSNHPAHGGFRGRVVPAAELAELVAGVAERGGLGRCDAVLSGYLGSSATGDVVRDVVGQVRAANPGALYCCDPVIGDASRGIYVGRGIPECLRDTLVPVADVVTPNPFELEYLTGQAPASLPAALEAGDRLRAAGARCVVVTGLRLPDAAGQRLVLAVTEDGAWVVRAPERAVRVHGTGDAFAALLLGRLLATRDWPAAVEHAVGALDAVLASAEATDADELPLVAAQEALVRPPVRYPAARLR
jgi:pyridoxine kinase